MLRKVLVSTVAIVLAACGQSSSEDSAAATPTVAAAENATAAAGDPCTLLDDPTATFARPVTAQTAAMPNNTQTCEWHSADSGLCGSIVVFGPGWNDVADVRSNFRALVSSMGAFGEVREVAGIGEEARVVDGGMFGAQLAFRTSNAAALVGASCGSDSLPRAALVEKVARAVVEKL